MPSYRTYSNVCEVCGKEFTSKRNDAHYCSATCRQKARQNRIVSDKDLIEVYDKMAPSVFRAISGDENVSVEVERANLTETVLLITSGETILRMTTHIDIIHE